MAFIGWTAIGMANVKPVTTLKSPAKKRPVAKSNPFCADIANSRGRSVPRSPSEPASSFRSNRVTASGRTGRTVPWRNHKSTRSVSPASAPGHFIVRGATATG
jgi:hypothetical protein